MVDKFSDEAKVVRDGSGAVLPVFTVREIQTGVTTLDTTEVLAFRVGESVTYHLNADSGNTATLSAGSIVGVPASVTSVTFGSATTVEIM